MVIREVLDGWEGRTNIGGSTCMIAYLRNTDDIVLFTGSEGRATVNSYLRDHFIIT